MSVIKGTAGQPFSAAAIRWSIYVIVGLSLVSLMLRVTARTVALAQNASPAPSATPTFAPTHVVIVAAVPSASATPAPSGTPVTPTPTASPTATQIPVSRLTAIFQAECSFYYQISPDLLTNVSKDQALPRDFQPADLAIVPLQQKNMAFRPIPLRRVVHQALLDMLDAMNQAGLSIWVMSGYRSYGEQQLAYEKWQTLYPDRAADISAVPGHSEHQLGTVVDFSTPYMDDLYNDFFHVNFSITPEGQWLSKQAADYGFTLSYPAWAAQITGYAWEPWHYRYVGMLAQELFRRNITLTQYIQECAPR
jgi:D-alanyl-D-alanine carboxypeptidase